MTIGRMKNDGTMRAAPELSCRQDPENRRAKKNLAENIRHARKKKSKLNGRRDETRSRRKQEIECWRNRSNSGKRKRKARCRLEQVANKDPKDSCQNRQASLVSSSPHDIRIRQRYLSVGAHFLPPHSKVRLRPSQSIRPRIPIHLSMPAM